MTGVSPLRHDADALLLSSAAALLPEESGVGAEPQALSVLTADVCGEEAQAGLSLLLLLCGLLF